MTEVLHLHYIVDGDDFTVAGEASSNVKQVLRKLNINPEVIRKVAISLYEGEINMVIHANGGNIDVDIYPDKISMVLDDNGPGIANVSEAMREGFSTATSTVRELGFGAGMGLPNMKRYSDEMRIETKLGVGTKIFMVVYNDI